jgi:hypothetical protein
VDKERNTCKSSYNEIHKNMGFTETSNMMKNSYTISHGSMKWIKNVLSLSLNTLALIHSLCNSTLIQKHSEDGMNDVSFMPHRISTQHQVVDGHIITKLDFKHSKY